MKNQKIITRAGQCYTGLSILALAWVSALSVYHPQSTMDLVKVSLTNNDAISSIRGIYGGVGLALVISLVYLYVKELLLSLQFLTLFWGGYALSRIITILADGPLGDFGRQWLYIETGLFLCGLLLVMLSRNGALAPQGMVS